MPFFFFRYKNILPYDHSRIKLLDKIEEIDDGNCDYLNGSWITTADHRIESDGTDMTVPDNKASSNAPCSNISFLATQGPTAVTVQHQLQMIHQEKVDLVVMLTRLIEAAGQGK